MTKNYNQHDDDEEEDTTPKCMHCGGPGVYLGHFGPKNAIHRCRNCGAIFGHKDGGAEEKKDDKKDDSDE